MENKTNNDIDNYIINFLMEDLSWLDYYDMPVYDNVTADDLKIINVNGCKLQNNNVYDSINDYIYVGNIINDYIYVGNIDGYFDGNDHIENYFEIWCKSEKVIGAI